MTDVERYLSMSPRDHARRLVQEVITKRYLNQQSLDFRVAFKYGINTHNPAKFTVVEGNIV